MAKTKLKVVEEVKPLKLDLGCGPNTWKNTPDGAGYIGVDELSFDGKVDVVTDLKLIWPWDNDSVDEVHCSHFLEHLTGEERVHFWNELYRVLKPDAKALIIVPHWSSERAYGDPTHKWPPVVAFSFHYLHKEWRDANAPHCGYTCNFEFSGGNAIHPIWNGRNQEMQMFAQTHYINVATDLWCTVVKK